MTLDGDRKVEIFGVDPPLETVPSFDGREGVLCATFDADGVTEGILELSEVLGGFVRAFCTDKEGIAEEKEAATACGVAEAIDFGLTAEPRPGGRFDRLQADIHPQLLQDICREESFREKCYYH